jgi:Ribonuclease G/E
MKSVASRVFLITSMQGAEERRLRRIEKYAADDALMVDQGVEEQLERMINFIV